jgi:hypothetical protein
MGLGGSGFPQTSSEFGTTAAVARLFGFVSLTSGSWISIVLIGNLPASPFPNYLLRPDVHGL